MSECLNHKPKVIMCGCGRKTCDVASWFCVACGDGDGDLTCGEKWVKGAAGRTFDEFVRVFGPRVIS